MKVDKELLERYHLGICTAVEKAMVENWLLNDDKESDITLPAKEKQHHKQEMWEAITSSLPDYNTDLVSSPKKYFTLPRLAGAASLIIGIIVLGVVYKSRTSEINDTVSLSNAASAETKKIDTKKFSITLAPESKAEINSSVSNIDFCGTIMISPKADFKLTIQGSCATRPMKSNTVNLKKGNTYIAVQYRFNKENELIIVNERNLSNLPPLLQREILHQLNI